MRVSSYPKVYNLGHKAIEELLLDSVVVDEKLDGSQWSFRLDDDGLHCRSKGQQSDPGQQQKMFDKAVATVVELKPLLHPGWTYRTEFLGKPKQNTLAYDRTPEKYLMLFDVDMGEQAYMLPEDRQAEADRIGLECVPVLLSGMLTSFDQFTELMGTLSVLGGSQVEGVVIKNYSRWGRDGKALMGKYVSEKFKEVHGKDWKGRHPGGAEVRQAIGQKLRTEARWHKAIQHLRENGTLTDSPRDIGPLMREVSQDVLAECEDQIKAALFKWAWKDISRAVTHGLPEWYKELLARSQFDVDSAS